MGQMRIVTDKWPENMKIKYVLEDLNVDGRIMICYQSKF
jgi:hypothetical protein